MEPAAVMTTLRPAFGAIGWCALLAFILPLGGAYVLGLSPAAACGLVASAFVIEYRIHPDRDRARPPRAVCGTGSHLH